MDPSSSRPLRRDAERNRQRILAAARDLFAERGIDVTLNEIAHHAEVGVGTVYRRFPDRDALIVELYEPKVERLVALADTAASSPDAWQGIADLLASVLELTLRDRALRGLVCDTPASSGQFPVRERLIPRIDRILTRAKEAAQIRGDVHTSDLLLVLLMFFPILDGAREVKPDLWRRYLPIVLRGLRAEAGAPDVLPVTAPHIAQAELVMARSHRVDAAAAASIRARP